MCCLASTGASSLKSPYSRPAAGQLRGSDYPDFAVRLRMFLMPDNKWARILAYVTGLVNQKLLLQNEYLAAENRVLRAHLPARLRLSAPERSTLAEIGQRLGRSALQQVACVLKPDTILAWYR